MATAKIRIEPVVIDQAHICFMVMLNIRNEQAGQGSNSNINQEAYWHVVGFKINTDHGTEFKVNKQ